MDSLPVIDRSATAPLSLPHHNLSVQEMYQLSTKNNTSWGIEGYKVPAEYIDTVKLKEISTNSVKRPAPRALNKPDYLTDTMKATKNKPAPNHYNIVKPWFDKDKEKKAAKYITKKNTFIDLIVREAKTKPTPGPGAHNVIKDVPDLKKKGGEQKPKGSERKDFLCEVQYVSNTIPGPGNYNPREIQPKVHENKMTPDDWKKKHTTKRTKSANPDKDKMEKERLPLPVTFDTFEKYLAVSKDKSKAQPKTKIWGTTERFNFKKDNKKDAKNAVPGPGQYAMVAEWNGKLPPAVKDTKEKNWMNKVTKGVEKSIYYS